MPVAVFVLLAGPVVEKRVKKFNKRLAKSTPS